MPASKRPSVTQIRPAFQVVPAADEQRRDDRQQVAELHHREVHRAQEQGEAFRRVRAPDVGFGALKALRLQAERLDRAGRLHCLRETVGHVRIGGALPQVTGRRAAQIPACTKPQHGYAQQTRQRQQRADDDERTDREHHGHAGHQNLRDGEPDAVRQRIHVPRGTGE
jgi:hypothetical protein